jgi:TPR repeat protein
MIHLHSHDVFHRHLSPDTIQYDAEFNPKVSDFYFAKSCRNDAGQSSIHNRGGEEYVSPEAAALNPYSSSVDVFSYGMILFRLLTGKPIWPGIDGQRKTERITRGDRPEFPPGTNERMMTLIKDCWNQNESARPSFAHIVRYFDDWGPLVNCDDFPDDEYLQYCERMREATHVHKRYREVFEADAIRPEDLEAFRACETRANSGIMREKFRLAKRFSDGLGVRKDDVEAFRVMKEAAEGGYPEAMFALGMCYREGKGCDKSDADAAAWFRRAAGTGHMVGQLMYARYLAKGSGVDKNEKMAIEELTKVAERDESSNSLLGRAQEEMGVIYRQMGKDTRNEAHLVTARHYFREAADRQSMLGAELYAVMLFLGEGGEKDVEQAIDIFTSQAGRSGFAAKQMGVIYEQGLEEKVVDLELAYDFYVVCAGLGYYDGEARAGNLAGRMADEKRKVNPRDPGAKQLDEACVEYFRNAGTVGRNSQAMFRYAKIVLDGLRGVEADIVKGIGVLQDAAKLGSQAACLELGAVFENGRGPIAVDLEKAREYYSAVRDSENPNVRDAARKALARLVS